MQPYHNVLYHYQIQNIRSLCSAPLMEAQLHCPQLIPECEAVRDKFEPLFALFSRCHALYDQSTIENVEELGLCLITITSTCTCTTHTLFTTEEAITTFMAYYRRMFPEASITVKLHMLEEHLVPFLTLYTR